MDANDRPGPELGAAGADEDRAVREAACRATHPSSRRPAGPVAGRNLAAAAHYERAAVGWLATQRDHLDAWPEDEAELPAALGAVGDLARLVGLRLRRGTEPLNSDFDALVTWLADLAARADTRTLLRHEPTALLPLVTVQWALTAHGRPDPCLAQALEIVLADRSVVGIARTPQDQIALHFLLAQSGIDLPCPQLTDLLATSVVADDKTALELSVAEVRGLVSIVITATDFGTAQVPWPAGRTPARVAAALQEWLLLAMAADDPGLVAALLTGLTCLHVDSGELTETARRWLHGWQESDGRSDGLASDDSSNGSGWSSWAAAIRTTTLTAVDGLLTRSTPAALPVRAPAATAMDTSSLVDSVMAAADWLDAVLPSTHVPGRLSLSEAWLALGDEAEARRQLLRLAEDPHLAFTVLKQTPELAVHLAALVVALDISSPPLVDLCEDVAALLSHPDAARQLFGPPPGGTPVTPAAAGHPAIRGEDLELARRTHDLCVDLLRHGPRHDPRTRPGLADLLLLGRAAQRATQTGDVGWLALALRGLQRLELAPPRLLRDAVVVLRGRQREDGALGGRPPGDCRGTDDRQVRWTLATLTALVEALPPMDLPRAA
jgi:hypothetical protein